MFDYVALLRRRESDDRLWQLTAACQPNRGRREAQKVWGSAIEIASVTHKRLSAFEMVDDETRVQMIGGEAAKHGERWLAANRSHVEWLTERGVTIEQAIERHDRWLAVRVNDPFFSRSDGDDDDSPAV